MPKALPKLVSFCGVYKSNPVFGSVNQKLLLLLIKGLVFIYLFTKEYEAYGFCYFILSEKMLFSKSSP